MRCEKKLKTEKPQDRRSVLEDKAIQGIESLSDIKGYRMWNRKLKNALEQWRRTGRKLLMWLDTVTEQAVNDEFDAVHDSMHTKMEAIYGLWKEYIGPHKDDRVSKEDFQETNKDLWDILVDKAKGEAWNKFNAS